MNSRTERFATLGGVTLLHAAALAGLALLAGRSLPITPPQLAHMELVSLPAPQPLAAPAMRTPPRPELKPKLERPAPRRTVVKSPPLLSTTAPRPSPAAPAATPSPAPEERRSEPTVPTNTAAPTKAAEAPEPPVTPPLYRGGYLDNPKPRYPALSMELNESGTVRVRVQVSAEGLPQGVTLAQTSGYPRLDRAALEAVNKWRFIPARRGQEAIPYTFIVPVDFSLKSH